MPRHGTINGCMGSMKTTSQETEIRALICAAIASLTQPVQTSGTHNQSSINVLRGDASFAVIKLQAALALLATATPK